MKNLFLVSIITFAIFSGCSSSKSSVSQSKAKTSGNPIFEGWYADPEGAVFGKEYWVFPTYSAAYKQQLHLDAFSSKDLVTWEKHPNVIDTSVIKWAKQAIWAPAIVTKDKKYYLFFSANDVQRPSRAGYDPKNTINHFGGIGVAVADNPGGPYKDYLGKPLIGDFHNDAQPIDQGIFKDKDGTWYMFYGGWGHCNMVKLNKDFTGFLPWEDGNLFKEITPKGYVEGPFMFSRKGKYYLMWSEGGWTNGTYKVAYGISDKPTGPFNRIGTILESNPAVATGAGHNSVINTPGTDNWYIVYHRRPIPNLGRDHRVTCIDKLEFEADGTIKQVVMTVAGVQAAKIR